MFSIRVSRRVISNVTPQNIFHILPFRNIQNSKIMKPKILVTRADIPEEGLNLLRKSCDVCVWQHNTAITREGLIENAKGVDGIFCLLTDKIDRDVLDSAGPSLKVIATMSVGYDHIDLDAVRERKIRVGFTPDILTDATAELTVGLILAVARRLMEAYEEARNGGWKAWAPLWMCGPGLQGSTVGIVGLGRIGLEVAYRLKPFKISKIIYYNRKEKPEAKEIGAEKVTFDELLCKSDIIIVTCALTAETKYLFNRDAFAKMKKNCLFINSSRGTIVDQDALIDALKNKTIAGAGLDVTTPEPLPLDSPLFQLKNCVVLPHIGSARTNTRIAMSVMTAENILNALNNTKMPAELQL